MRILLSNDDGINALGLNTLRESLSEVHEVITVAPLLEKSGAGHALTISEPLRVHSLGENRYSLNGTPADCVFFALGTLYKNNPPDLVISGINHGANLGQDRFYSGTVAAAREGIFRGVPGVAVSLVTNSKESVFYFKDASHFILKLLQNKVHELLSPMELLNINLPNIPQKEIRGVRATQYGLQSYSGEVIERVDHRGKNYFWIGGKYEGHKKIKDSDCDAVFSNCISLTLENFISKESLEEKEEEMLQRLK